ncbi:uncharacterized protein N7503_009217 [Penicillium pulvis]|uniref:uncharacterized protein n=1 Tax=Penicillium pulvis TaxID=1562058 RepID=UPI002547B91C|nr:uncharacterized protein N7503_009217 [Penicillium pulvis]KAJ5793239.1 hypothetical protein N7503_009217 [Penicillium pulvis]
MSAKLTVGAGGRAGFPPSPPFKRPEATDFDKVAALAKFSTVCTMNSKVFKAHTLSLQAEELKALGAQLIKAGLALINTADEPAARPRRHRHGRGREGRGGGKKAQNPDAAGLNSAPVANDVAQAVILAHPASPTTQGTTGATNDKEGIVDNPGKRTRHRGGRRRRRRQADAGAGGGEETTSSFPQASPMHREGRATSPPMEISLPEVIAALATSLSQVMNARLPFESQEDWLIEFSDSE